MLTLLLILGSFASEFFPCPICKMATRPTLPQGYEVHKQGTKTYFCSYSCLRRFLKQKDGPAFAHDFIDHQPVPIEEAFFIVKSDKILLELEFDMPPSVVAFRQKAAAEKKLKQLGDGKIVLGFSNLEKEF